MRTSRERIVSVRLSEPEFQHLRTLADRAGASMSDILRSLFTPPMRLPGIPMTVPASSLIWSADGPDVEIAGAALTVRLS